ncbi:alpha/beta hydrolase [Aureimonas pseudogalii]|uniref:Acetyl esterase/lipase n=1 Tax=Aureimonas pseudogalii TaxID=1744844 RepID=A0A7W6EFY7_9HYPH|nr:alpha/beta hydrolase [Aureimonas pseudogalii]MBB3997995.1 acetyl esterase/lipase [Aureimonas pseudogalii]
MPTPDAFGPDDPELAAMNAEIAAFQAARPSPWSLPLDVVRQARREGRGVFPALVPDPAACESLLRGRGGHSIPLRVLRPTCRPERGTYLHFHGGGWVFGEAVENDPRLRALAEATGLAVVSVDYRLAPEHPFPAGPDDCEDAALALAAGRIDDLPTGFLAIGGESAGAHLAAVTLLRLRDRHGLTPFAGANLVAGCFDLSMTPSVRRFGGERLILNTGDVEAFATRFVPPEFDRRDPAVSPLYADLTGLPPALFTVGTRDLLLDDTLFMASRWQAAGNGTTLSVWPGGCHVFQAFASRAADASMGEMNRFLAASCDAHATRSAAAPAAAPRD